MLILKWVEDHAGLAAWVQAVGSLLALGVAIWISRREVRAARRTRLETQKDRLREAKEIAGAVVDYTKIILRDTYERDDPTFEESIKITGDEVDHLREALKYMSRNNAGDIPLSEIIKLQGVLSFTWGMLYPELRKMALGGDPAPHKRRLVEQQIRRAEAAKDAISAKLTVL